MGGWQAALAGIGQAGNDIGGARIANREEQLKEDYTRAQIQQMRDATAARQRELDLTQTGQEQQFQFQKSTLDLQRDTLEQNGLKPLGAVRQADGSYKDTWFNPVSKQTLTFDLPTAPADTFEGQNRMFQQIKSAHPDWDDDTAGAIAFNAPALLKQGPDQTYLGFYNEGVHNPKLLGKGQTARDFALEMFKLIYAGNSYIGGMFGQYGSPGSMTASQKRLYDTQVGPMKSEATRREAVAGQDKARQLQAALTNPLIMYDAAKLAAKTAEIEAAYQKAVDSIELDYQHNNQQLVDRIMGTQQGPTGGQSPYNAGDKIMYKGTQRTVRSVNADGTLVLEPIGQ